MPLAVLYLYEEIAPRYPSAGRTDEVVFACFLSGAALCLGMSATYHTFSNHSERVAKWGNKLDYSGIVCLIVGSYVPALYYGLFCKPVLLSLYLYAVSLFYYHDRRASYLTTGFARGRYYSKLLMSILWFLDLPPWSCL